jgi:hypothetical protein
MQSAFFCATCKREQCRKCPYSVLLKEMFMLLLFIENSLNTENNASQPCECTASTVPISPFKALP